ncbi:uncharacterized protein V6R79_010094 [Siganus canaliculatus]
MTAMTAGQGAASEVPGLEVPGLDFHSSKSDTSAGFWLRWNMGTAFQHGDSQKPSKPGSRNQTKSSEHLLLDSPALDLIVNLSHES